jgi:hypothetical protein
MATEKESATRGQTVVSSTGPDKSSHKLNSGEAMNGRSMPDRGVITDPALYNAKSKNGNIPK